MDFESWAQRIEFSVAESLKWFQTLKDTKLGAKSVKILLAFLVHYSKKCANFVFMCVLSNPVEKFFEQLKQRELWEGNEIINFIFNRFTSGVKRVKFLSRERESNKSRKHESSLLNSFSVCRKSAVCWNYRKDSRQNSWSTNNFRLWRILSFFFGRKTTHKRISFSSFSSSAGNLFLLNHELAMQLGMWETCEVFVWLYEKT